jgi:hypothetical protein
MKFRNYCIVIMGDTVNVVTEISSIADSKPNVLDAKGVLISTFTSFAEPRELTDFFKQKNRNFLIFDLNSDNSGFNIVKEEINHGLFGFLDAFTEDELQKRTQDLIHELTSTTIADIVIDEEENKTILLDDIDEMSQRERDFLLNKLLDKGPDRLSPYDKKILKKLAIS